MDGLSPVKCSRVARYASLKGECSAMALEKKRGAPPKLSEVKGLKKHRKGKDL
jgi:hypothetical protein